MFNLKNSSNVISKILLFFSIILISTNTVLASKKPTAENEIKNETKAKDSLQDDVDFVVKSIEYFLETQENIPLCIKEIIINGELTVRHLGLLVEKLKNDVLPKYPECTDEMNFFIDDIDILYKIRKCLENALPPGREKEEMKKYIKLIKYNNLNINTNIFDVAKNIIVHLELRPFEFDSFSRKLKREYFLTYLNHKKEIDELINDISKHMIKFRQDKYSKSPNLKTIYLIKNKKRVHKTLLT